MRTSTIVILLVGLLAATPPIAQSSTVFTYQGQLAQDGSPHTGEVDMIFSLWDAEVDGNQLGTDLSDTVSVSDGLFQVELDFGDQPYASELWLQIVADGTTLSPRQPITATPLALHALNIPEGQFWRLDGNTGTTAGAHFLGTADDVPLEVKVNNQRVLWLEGEGANHPGSANLIGGSAANTIALGAEGVTIAGGGYTTSPNQVTSEFGSIGGGLGNSVFDPYATVGGGQFNTASGWNATIGGGVSNTAFNSYATISGGNSNNAAGAYSTVGGGHSNTASSSRATVSGGDSNTASSSRATVSGGDSNTASSSYSTVGGGYSNTTSDNYATVGGGYLNTASNTYATISGGYNNNASGTYSIVSGGTGNNANGLLSIVPGGISNLADGDYSFAAGRRAKALHNGAFVWADATGTDFESTGENQFLVRAGGGSIFDSSLQANEVQLTNRSAGDHPQNPERWTLASVRQDGSAIPELHFHGPEHSVVGDPGSVFSLEAVSGLAVFGRADKSVDLTVRGEFTAHERVRLLELDGSGSTSLCLNSSNYIAGCSSSRRYKQDIAPLEDVTTLIGQLRPVSFRWIDSGSEDFGLVAEEVAEIEPRLVTFNADGQIKGVKYRQLSALLIRAWQQQREEIAELRELAQQNAKLEARLARLETLLHGDRQFAEHSYEH